MGAALAIRDELTAAALRRHARFEPNRRAALRMLAIANALDPGSRWLGTRLESGRFFKELPEGEFRACVYATGWPGLGSDTASSCLGLDMPSFFRVSASAGPIRVR